MGRESLAVVTSPPTPSGGTLTTATAPRGTAAAAATSLAPGFRFHPTDEELVSYYLKRKVLGKPVRFDAIGEVDIYKHEPWDLAVFSRLKTRDQEWYFYSALDKKYGNGARMNRATNKGYWKATGKDREIRRDVQLLGMKKTLVFHSGRAPDGLRTNWVMHEYRLVEYEIENNGNLVQDAYVLCRVFHKNNIGPPSGNRYAPFMEEEWADDDVGGMIPGVDVRVRAEPLLVANGNSQIAAGNNQIANGNNQIAAGNNQIANGNNQMNQEIQPASKDLININELPSDTTPMDIDSNQQNHRENALKLQENHHESALKLQENRPESALKLQENRPENALKLQEDIHRENVLKMQEDIRRVNALKLQEDNHHENSLKLEVNNNNNHFDAEEEALKREHTEVEERPAPICVLNKEAPLPLLQYKRRRQNESNNNSSRNTQDHCSSTTTVDNTTTLVSSTAAATNTAISALLEFSLMGISDKKDKLQQLQLRPHKEPSLPPVASPEERLKDLEKEIHQMSVERETFKLEMMSAEAMISILQSRIDALRQENEELKKNNTKGKEIV